MRKTRKLQLMVKKVSLSLLQGNVTNWGLL